MRSRTWGTAKMRMAMRRKSDEQGSIDITTVAQRMLVQMEMEMEMEMEMAMEHGGTVVQLIPCWNESNGSQLEFKKGGPRNEFGKTIDAGKGKGSKNANCHSLPRHSACDCPALILR